MTTQIAAPGARLDYDNKWDQFLPEGDSRASGIWTITPDEGLPGGSMLENPEDARVWIAEGMTVRGKIYVLEEKITSVQGRTPGGRGFTIYVEDNL